MKKISLLISAILNKFKLAQTSMQKRFIIFFLSILLSIILFLFLLLNLFGVVYSTDLLLENTMNQQLDHSSEILQNDFNQLATYAWDFSKQIAIQVDNFKQQKITFDEFQENYDVLYQFQKNVYPIVYSNMRHTSCSGAFYFLNTTINSKLEDTYYNGIYLKFANLYAKNTIHNDICMYRGNNKIARLNNINLHSTWQYEFKEALFPQVSSILKQTEIMSNNQYVLTTAYKLEQAWENVRYLCVPIYNKQNEALGVCGFEISELYFKLAYQTSDSNVDNIICALLTKQDDNTYISSLSGSRSGYSPYKNDVFTIEAQSHFTYFKGEEFDFIGKCKEVQIGSTTHVIAAMIPKAQYDLFIKNEQLKLIGLMIIIVISTIVISLFVSKKYVDPIIKGVEQIKNSDNESISTGIFEIDDLFAFLEQKDKDYEEKIQRLNDEKDSIQSQYDQVQSYVSYITNEKMPEVDKDLFQMFVEGINTLTPKEKEIFDLYLQGKKAKEIMEILCINQNTVKYHNKNIYSKLGINSRKQLVEYATLMKYNINES